MAGRGWQSKLVAVQSELNGLGPGLVGRYGYADAVHHPGRDGLRQAIDI